MEKVALQNLMNNSLLFCDTSSLMHTKAPTTLYFELLPVLKDKNKKMLITHRIKNEIKGCRNHSKPESRILAQCALGIMQQFCSMNLLEIVDDKCEAVSGDQSLLQTFLQLRTKNNLILITQDKALSKDIKELENIRAVLSPFSITLLKINKDGDLQEWEWFDSQSSENAKVTGITDNNAVWLVCEYCQNKFSMARYHAKRLKEHCCHIYCCECNETLKKKGVWLNCSTCHTPFFYSLYQQIDFDSRGYDAPKRCVKCNRERKTHKKDPMIFCAVC